MNISQYGLQNNTRKFEYWAFIMKVLNFGTFNNTNTWQDLISLYDEA